METQNYFVLNEAFKQNAKVYQTKPVLATKYQPGMETGFAVYFTNKMIKDSKENTCEGMKFFDTEQEAWDYINADNKQYAEINGVLVDIPVEYDAPVPVLHRVETDIEKKVGILNFCGGQYTFQSNETDIYDFFILDYNHTTPDIWIIQDSDGNIRIWDKDCGENFFGKIDNYICEKTEDNTYISVAI